MGMEHLCPFLDPHSEWWFISVRLAAPMVGGYVWDNTETENTTCTNNVLLVKIEGPVWYTIYHHLPVVKGVNKPLY